MPVSVYAAVSSSEGRRNKLGSRRLRRKHHQPRGAFITAVACTRQLGASRGPRLKPGAQTDLAFPTASAGERPFDSDVLVEERPLNGVPSAQQPPLTPLGVRTVHQPGKPVERHYDGASVRQPYTERLLCDLDGDGNWLRFKHQSRHSMPPGGPADVLPPGQQSSIRDPRTFLR